MRNLWFCLSERRRTTKTVARHDGTALGYQTSAEKSERFKVFYAQKKPSERKVGKLSTQSKIKIMVVICKNETCKMFLFGAVKNFLLQTT